MRCLQILRTKAFILLLVMCIAIFATVIRSDLKKRRKQIEAARHTALLLVGNLAEQQAQTENETLKMLVSLAASPVVQGLDPKACNELFFKLKLRHRYYSGIGAVTPDGNLFASSEAFEPDSVNILDQKHIKEAIGTGHFSAGEYSLGKVTGIKIIHYGLPMFGPEGKINAVLTTGFMLDKYAPLIEKAHLSTDSVVVITDHSGVRLYRSPESDAAALGQHISRDCFEKISADGDEGIFEGVGGDGKYRINAFKRFRLRPDSPPYLYMLVGYAKDELTQNANFMMHTTLFILGLLSIVIFALVWAIVDLSNKKSFSS